MESLEPATGEVDGAARDFWRLGHRRPWWQWNVLTLFGALFVLVWARELFALSQTVTWVTCVWMLAAWLCVPITVQTCRDAGVRAVCSGAAFLLLALVTLWAGMLVGGVAVAAAILLAVAVRARHD